jgi:hypothetical protein
LNTYFKFFSLKLSVFARRGQFLAKLLHVCQTRLKENIKLSMLHASSVQTPTPAQVLDNLNPPIKTLLACACAMLTCATVDTHEVACHSKIGRTPRVEVKNHLVDPLFGIFYWICFNRQLSTSSFGMEVNRVFSRTTAFLLWPSLHKSVPQT